jgi:hypothetical protein
VTYYSERSLQRELLNPWDLICIEQGNFQTIVKQSTSNLKVYVKLGASLERTNKPGAQRSYTKLAQNAKLHSTSKKTNDQNCAHCAATDTPCLPVMIFYSSITPRAWSSAHGPASIISVYTERARVRRRGDRTSLLGRRDRRLDDVGAFTLTDRRLGVPTCDSLSDEADEHWSTWSVPSSSMGVVAIPFAAVVIK